MRAAGERDGRREQASDIYRVGTNGGGQTRTTRPRTFLSDRCITKRYQTYRDRARLLQRQVVQEHGACSMLTRNAAPTHHDCSFQAVYVLPVSDTYKNSEKGQESRPDKKVSTTTAFSKVAQKSQSFLPCTPNSRTSCSLHAQRSVYMSSRRLLTALWRQQTNVRGFLVDSVGGSSPSRAFSAAELSGRMCLAHGTWRPRCHGGGSQLLLPS